MDQQIEGLPEGATLRPVQPTPAATDPSQIEGLPAGATLRSVTPPAQKPTVQNALPAHTVVAKAHAAPAAPAPAPAQPTTLENAEHNIGKAWDATKRYGSGLAESVGLPSSVSEMEAADKERQAHPIKHAVENYPPVAVGRQLYGMGKELYEGAKRTGKEAYEAGQNIAEGQPVLQQMAKPASEALNTAVKAVPFIGAPTEQAGEDVVQKNYAHAAGELTGAIGQVAIPELHEALAGDKTLKFHEERVAEAKKALDKAKEPAKPYEHSAAQGILPPKDIQTPIDKAQAALDEAQAHRDIYKEGKAKQIAAAKAKRVAAPTPAAEVPAGQVEALPTLKKLATEPAKSPMPAINVKTPGQIQPETFPQVPTERPRAPLGRIELPEGQGTVGRMPLLTEGTPEAPKPSAVVETPKPATDEGALRDLKANKGEVVESPEKKVGRLLQEALKPETKTAPEYAGEERRTEKRPALMSPTEIESAMKNRKPVHTPFDVTHGAMDTIKRDQAMPKHPSEETAKPKEVFYRGTNADESAKIEDSGKITPDALSSGHLTPDKATAEAYAKANGGKVYTVNAEHVPEKDLSHYRETGRGPITLSSEVPTVEHAGRPSLPNEEDKSYTAKKEEVVPSGTEGREPAKSAAEYHPAVQQKVSELSDENLRKLAKAHGLTPSEYDFNARDERRHRVERDQLAKDITEQLGDDEKINVGRAAESAEKEGTFKGADVSAQGRAARAAKVFPRLRGPVDEFGNPKVSGGTSEWEPPKGLEKGISHNEPVSTDIPLDKISVSKKALDSAQKNTASGRGTKTEGPINLFYNTDNGQYLVEDGMHRLAKAHADGKESIPATLWSGYSDVIANVRPEDKAELGKRTVGTAEAAKSDNEHFANAKKELGPNASISDVAKRAQEMKDASKGTSFKQQRAMDEAAYKKADLKRVVSDYNKAEGLPEVKDNKLETDPRGKEIAKAYEDMKHNPDDPEVKKSYSALIDDAKKQWNALEKSGIKIEPTDEDPYKSYEEMKKDFDGNKRLKVFRGGNPLPEDHPLAKVDPKTGETYNVMFRAVHDAIGHLLHDNDFSEKGEENAYDTHRQTMSKEAIPALTTETKGQVAAFFNKEGGKGFPDQKAGILPEKYTGVNSKGSPVDEYGNPTVSGGAPEKKLLTGDELIKKYGESSGDPAHTTFILKDGRGVANTGIEHDRMLGGKPTDKVPPREQFVADGNIRIRPRSGGRGGREVSISIPESGINEKQLAYLKKMSPQLRSGAVMLEVGKPGGNYKVIDYEKASDEELEKTLRELAPITNEKGSPVDNEEPSLEKLGEKKKKSPYGKIL